MGLNMEKPKNVMTMNLQLPSALAPNLAIKVS